MFVSSQLASHDPVPQDIDSYLDNPSSSVYN
jgi:hypothetical protein